MEPIPLRPRLADHALARLQRDGARDSVGVAAIIRAASLEPPPFPRYRTVAEWVFRRAESWQRFDGRSELSLP